MIKIMKTKNERADMVYLVFSRCKRVPFTVTLTFQKIQVKKLNLVLFCFFFPSDQVYSCVYRQPSTRGIPASLRLTASILSIKI